MFLIALEKGWGQAVLDLVAKLKGKVAKPDHKTQPSSCYLWICISTLWKGSHGLTVTCVTLYASVTATNGVGEE